MLMLLKNKCENADPFQDPDAFNLPGYNSSNYEKSILW